MKCKPHMIVYDIQFGSKLRREDFKHINKKYVKRKKEKEKPTKRYESEPLVKTRKFDWIQTLNKNLIGSWWNHRRSLRIYPKELET